MAVRHLPGTFLLLFAFVSQGCAVVAVDNLVRYRDGEGVFARDWFDRIVPGSSSRQELLEQYGPPFRIVDGPDGGQLASWEFMRQQQKRTSVFGLIRYTNTEESRHYLHAVLHNAVVIRRWQDQTRDVDAPAVFQAVGLRRQAPVEESQGLLPGIGVVPRGTPLQALDAPDSKAPPALETKPEMEPAPESAIAPESGKNGFVRPL